MEAFETFLQLHSQQHSQSYLERHYLRRGRKGRGIYAHRLKHIQVEKCSTTKISNEFYFSNASPHNNCQITQINNAWQQKYATL